jgi:adenylate cyclase
MNSGEYHFPSWLVAIVVLALAVAFVAVDPAGLASGFAAQEMGAFHRLDPLAVTRSVDSVAAQILLLETVGAALALLIAVRQPVWAVAVAIVAAILAQLASLLIYAHLHVAFDMTNSGAGLVLAALAGAIAYAVGPERAPRRILAETRPSLVPAPEGSAGDAAPAPVLGAETMSTLACGIFRLPALAQSFGSDGTGLVRLIETAMGALVDDATESGAALSRFDGASFAAHWRAGQTPAHAERACDAASRMVATTGKINAMLAERWPHRDTPCPAIELGIGLASGPVLAGHVRAHGSRTTLVVPGHEPAPERLAELAGQYGAAVLLSGEAHAAADRTHALLEVDFRALDPGASPLRLYVLLGNALLRASPKFRAAATFHARAFQAIAAREWEKARGLIEQCRNLSCASAKVYDLHLARIAWYESNPPPPDWDGAFRAPLV